MKSPVFKTIGSIPPRYIANFDSAAALAKALGNFLHGQDFPGVGMMPPSARPLAPIVNALPRQIREAIYVWSGWAEAIPPGKLGDVRSEELARWATNLYPRRQYPAVMVGSTSGATMHLAAALGIPWLPQTFLIPVRRTGVHPDEPRADMEWAREPGRTLLDANPDLQLHHMHDPNQDRLMVRRMTYFRVKRLTLGQSYERFLERNLEPGGTIIVVECQRQWPAVQVGERHIFQPGALGGATEEEFLQGSQRVAEYLERYDSHRRSFDTPEPDGPRPEAEWGFEPSLRGDIERFARRHGYKIRRLVFEEPEHPSPLVADLYRWWYRQRRIQSRRLLVESFMVVEPWWALRTGSAPFWMKFNMEPSLEWLERYLDGAEPYDEIYLMLFNHGVDAVGLPSIEQWREVLKRARKQGMFIGLDEDRYPRDFGSFIRYYTDIQEKIPARYEMPGPLTISMFERFLGEAGDRYPVEWLAHPIDG